MKRIFGIGLMVLILTLSFSTAFAQKSNVGCGLGTVIFQDSLNTTLVEVLAATTNGCFGNQTFGITSGTLECKQPAKFAGNERLMEFMSSNMDSVAVDMAAGSGESLETLAELMEVDESKRDGFYSKLQQNFDHIFTSSDIQSGEVIDNIIRVTS